MDAKRVRFVAALTLFLAWVLVLATMAVTTARQPDPAALAPSAPPDPAGR